MVWREDRPNRVAVSKVCGITAGVWTCDADARFKSSQALDADSFSKGYGDELRSISVQAIRHVTQLAHQHRPAGIGASVEIMVVIQCWCDLSMVFGRRVMGKPLGYCVNVVTHLA